MKTKIELGPIQLKWIESLKAHPERQTKNILGQGNPKEYKACCLGEALLCIYRDKKKKLPFKDGSILSFNEQQTKSRSALYEFSKLGLRGDMGEFSKAIRFKGLLYASLAQLNDGGASWPEIATLIVKHKNKLFTKSV